MLVAVSLTAFDLAWRAWAMEPGSSFRQMLDGVFARLADPADLGDPANLGDPHWSH